MKNIKEWKNNQDLKAGGIYTKNPYMDIVFKLEYIENIYIQDYNRFNGIRAKFSVEYKPKKEFMQEFFDKRWDGYLEGHIENYLMSIFSEYGALNVLENGKTSYIHPDYIRCDKDEIEFLYKADRGYDNFYYYDADSESILYYDADEDTDAEEDDEYITDESVLERSRTECIDYYTELDGYNHNNDIDSFNYILPDILSHCDLESEIEYFASEREAESLLDNGITQEQITIIEDGEVRYY